MKDLMTPFEFDGRTVRTIRLLDDTPYFFARDVASALGYELPPKAVADHCRRVLKASILDISKMESSSDYKTLLASGYSHNDLVRKQQFIPEADVFRLVMRSKLPSAEAFQEWVCEDVLPTLRKTGEYTLPVAKNPVASIDADTLRAVQDFYGLVTSIMPNLGESSRQSLIAGLTRNAVGLDCLPLPKVEETFYTATELAAEFHVSPQKLGRVANSNGLKEAAFGEYRLSKSPHSSKQVEQFYYNERGRQRLAELINSRLVD